jgi:hypothetical protein
LGENHRFDQRRRFGQAAFRRSFNGTLEAMLLFSVGWLGRSERDDGGET